MKFYNRFRHITPLFLITCDSILFYSIYLLNIKTGIITPTSLFPSEFGKEITTLFWNQGLVIGFIGLFLIQLTSYALCFKKKELAYRHVNLWKAAAILFTLLTTVGGIVAGVYWYLFLPLLIPIYLAKLENRKF